MTKHIYVEQKKTCCNSVNVVYI